MPNRLALFDAVQMQAQDKAPGWERGEGSEIFAHRKMGVFVWHVMWRDSEGNFLYDQILRAERGGGVFLPVDSHGRIGLLKAWRPQTIDQAKYAAAYPNVNVAELGRESWELPRGFVKLTELQEAGTIRETHEETQSRVTSARRLSYVCDNTASSPHMTLVMWGTIDPSKKPDEKPDPNEKILKGIEFFDRAELAELQREGKLYCAYTLAAIASFWLQNPSSC